MSKIVELYGVSTSENADWPNIVAAQQCPFLQRKCLKIRMSEPETTIGSCTVAAGRREAKIIICPFRLLQQRQIFFDCLHLLTLHQPGNELHVVAELHVPGGSIDYCLVSVRNGKPLDFVGLELQTLDTTGTVWPQRQRFAHQTGIQVKKADRTTAKPFGLNWKMTAKTILIQLHHKIQTFEHVNKHLVLSAQDVLFVYMKKEFSLDHLEQARLGDTMHFHSYSLEQSDGREWRLRLGERLSTDSQGIARCLGLQKQANVELEEILVQLAGKISAQSLLNLEQPLPPASLIDAASEEDR